MLREAMPEYVYVNGLHKKSITLKDGDIFAIDRTKMAETFVFVLGMEYARLNSGINWFHREMSSIGMPLPDCGIIDIAERFLYEYVIQDGAPLVLNRIPWSKENAQFATAWREHINEQIKTYGSTGAVDWDVDSFRRRLADFIANHDASATRRAASGNVKMGSKVHEEVWDFPEKRLVFRGGKDNSQAHSNALIQEEFNFIEDVGESRKAWAKR